MSFHNITLIVSTNLDTTYCRNCQLFSYISCGKRLWPLEVVSPPLVDRAERIVISFGSGGLWPPLAGLSDCIRFFSSWPVKAQFLECMGTSFSTPVSHTNGCCCLYDYITPSFGGLNHLHHYKIYLQLWYLKNNNFKMVPEIVGKLIRFRCHIELY